MGRMVMELRLRRLRLEFSWRYVIQSQKTLIRCLADV